MSIEQPGTAVTLIVVHSSVLDYRLKIQLGRSGDFLGSSGSGRELASGPRAGQV